MSYNPDDKIIQVDQLYYLLAERYFDLEKYERARDYIDEYQSTLKEKSLIKNKRLDMLYLKAKCNKQLKSFDEAQS